MPTYEIAGRQILILAILVLYVGTFLTKHFPFLRRNNIPESVTGGIICSVIITILALYEVVELDFNLDLRNLLLLIFFSTIGLNAKLKFLLRGGLALLILTISCGIFLVFQNGIGVVVAKSLGYNPVFGLFGGSIALAGGHGTAVAWGDIMASTGVRGVSEFGIACATFGLILGGLFGGPLAGLLIRRHNLQPSQADLEEAAAIQTDETGKPHHRVTIDDIIFTIFCLALCLGVGDAVNRYLFEYNIRLPGFLTAMMVGVLLTNLADTTKINLNHEGIDLIGGVCLQLFLAMSLMSMDLLSLADSFILLFTTMIFQAMFAMLFGFFIVFRMMGSDYDAAMIVGGFFGMGLGATPVAIANMDAVAKKHGPSVRALLIVPLVGAFFIDIVNAFTIQAFLRLPVLF